MITGDESWIFENDSETKRQREGWHIASSPRPKKARMSKLKVKSMVLCFLMEHWRIVHREFVTPGQIVNQVFYKDVLENIRKGLFA